MKSGQKTKEYSNLVIFILRMAFYIVFFQLADVKEQLEQKYSTSWLEHDGLGGNIDGF